MKHHTGGVQRQQPQWTWSLYIVDDATGDVGSISGGWSLDDHHRRGRRGHHDGAGWRRPTPRSTGNNVTFTATVRDGVTPVTTGTVSFTDGARPRSAANVAVNASGQATFTTTTLAEGTHLITATYSGATGFLTSTGNVSQIVDTPTTTPAQGQWCNTGPITGPGVMAGAATPYPSRITVSGAGTATTLVTVQLGSVSHQVPGRLRHHAGRRRPGRT